MHSQIRSDEEARARHAVPAIRSTASTAESSRDLRLVCQAPLGPTHRDPELSVAEKIQELLGLLQVGPAVPVRLAGTPLRGEDGNLRSILAQARKEKAVRPCIEVEGIHDIIGHLDGVCSSFVDILTPGWRTNDDDCLWIDLADHRDDAVGVHLDGGPVHTVGLVADLIKNVGFALVLQGCLTPVSRSICLRCTRTGQPVVRISGRQDMPVDDDIDSELLTPSNDLVHQLCD
mmetsp:Transcript_43637/g.104036  ORF Transcript_43637/g.104036 Transcript_43637/m.104036 type:complete len:232 (-) Transcript_43637:2316-3011(-)